MAGGRRGDGRGRACSSRRCRWRARPRAACTCRRARGSRGRRAERAGRTNAHGAGAGDGDPRLRARGRGRADVPRRRETLTVEPSLAANARRAGTTASCTRSRARAASSPRRPTRGALVHAGGRAAGTRRRGTGLRSRRATRASMRRARADDGQDTAYATGNGTLVADGASVRGERGVVDAQAHDGRAVLSGVNPAMQARGGAQSRRRCLIKPPPCPESRPTYPESRLRSP